jgi:hypothetical protein
MKWDCEAVSIPAVSEQPNWRLQQLEWGIFCNVLTDALRNQDWLAHSE